MYKKSLFDKNVPQQTFVIIHNIIVKMLELDIGNQTTTVLRKEGQNYHTACVYALPLAISLSSFMNIDWFLQVVTTNQRPSLGLLVPPSNAV